MNSFTSPLLKKTLTHAISASKVRTTDAKSSVGIEPLEESAIKSANSSVFFTPPQTQFMVGCIEGLSSPRSAKCSRRRFNSVQPTAILIEPNVVGSFLQLLESIIMSKNQLKAAGISAHTYQTYQLICYHLCGVGVATGLMLIGGAL